MQESNKCLNTHWRCWARDAEEQESSGDEVGFMRLSPPSALKSRDKSALQIVKENVKIKVPTVRKGKEIGSCNPKATLSLGPALLAEFFFLNESSFDCASLNPPQFATICQYFDIILTHAAVLRPVH